MTNPEMSEADVDDSTQIKTCTKCGETKALGDFHASRTGRLGCRADCRSCKQAQDLARWVPKREAGRAVREAARTAAANGETKVCIGCDEELPVTSFWLLEKGIGGRFPRCRACAVEQRRERVGRSPADKALMAQSVRDRPTKVCAKCKLELPRSKFRKKSRSASADGMQPRCRDCQGAWQRAHYERTRARRLEQSREWFASNRERKYKTQQAWSDAHRPELRAKAKEKREYFTAYMARRRALMREVTVGPVDLNALWTGSCGICHQDLDRSLKRPDLMSKSIDHIVPISRGGSHTQDNLQWSHLLCNIRKSNKMPAADDLPSPQG